MSDDDPRDRFLQQALRHAPDADAAPPPALRDAILREARSAVAPVAPPSLGTRLRAAAASAWAALARPRFAATFASLMAMTLAGVMWWGRPIEDAMPAREMPEAGAPAPVASVQPAPAPPPEVSAPPATPPADAARLRERVDAVRQAAPRPVPNKPARRAEEPAAADAQALPVPLPVPPPAPPAPVSLAAAPAPAPTVAAPPVAAAIEQRALAPSMADAAVAGAPPAAKTEARSAAPAGFALKRSAVDTEKATAPALTWDRADAGPARPADAAFRAWLGQLDRALAAAPPDASASAPADAASAPAARAPLRIWREGVLVRTLRFDGEGVVDEPAGQPPRRVRLAPGVAQRLAESLARLPR